MSGILGQSTRLPFACTRCGSLYPTPDLLVEDLARHEERDRRMREAQDEGPRNLRGFSSLAGPSRG